MKSKVQTSITKVSDDIKILISLDDSETLSMIIEKCPLEFTEDKIKYHQYYDIAMNADSMKVIHLFAARKLYFGNLRRFSSSPFFSALVKERLKDLEIFSFYSESDAIIKQNFLNLFINYYSSNFEFCNTILFLLADNSRTVTPYLHNDYKLMNDDYYNKYGYCPFHIYKILMSLESIYIQYPFEFKTLLSGSQTLENSKLYKEMIMPLYLIMVFRTIDQAKLPAIFYHLKLDRPYNLDDYIKFGDFLNKSKPKADLSNPNMDNLNATKQNIQK